jgi:histidine ammonia-lyase
LHKKALKTIHPSREQYRISDICVLLEQGSKLQLSEEAVAVIEANYQYLRKKLQKSEKPIYGINTGFGALCQVRIEEQELARLQTNLVVSHACGTGQAAPVPVVRIILLLKILSLSKGYSGVRPVIVQRLIDFYNLELYPVIYEQGSLGASGDLAPLAHLSLPLLGLGELWYKGERRSAAELLAFHELQALTLEAKEGLALLNGTQFSTAYATWSIMEGMKLLEMADRCGALSCEAFHALKIPFLPQSHQIRPHKGQMATANNLLHLLEDSELQTQEKDYVQDPYSFRCMPQVHGASRDTLEHAVRVIETELNAVTDNPNIFEESDQILSAGNFHAQPIAFINDFLAIAFAELANISERRIFQLISGLRGLPPFLVAKPGINSGYMIAQYTAASIVSQNKQLCTPASVDSIVSSAGQEDHVSMAANAGTKLYRVVENVWTVLAIEWMCAAQGLEFRRPYKTSPLLEKWHLEYRKIVPKLDVDRIIYTDIEKTCTYVRQGMNA